LIFHLWNSEIFILIWTLLCRRVVAEQFTITERGIWRVQNFTNLYMMVTLTYTLLLLGSTLFQEPRFFISGVYSFCYLPFLPYPQFQLWLIILYILYATHYPYNISSVVSLNYPLASSVRVFSMCIFRTEVASLTPSYPHLEDEAQPFSSGTYPST
jgi:hypothetical protein